MKKIRKYQEIPQILSWILISIFFISGCTESEGQKEEIQSSPRIRKGVSIVQPESGADFVLGDPISFQLVHKDDLPIDSVKLEIFETTISNIGNQVEWEASYTGSPDIKIFAYYGEKVEAVFPNVKILSDKEPQQMTYRIVNQFSHDENAYTQGLYFHNGQLIESTGQRGSSTIRITNYETGEIDKIKNLESKYFGEGATVFNNQIYQLTWTGQVAFVYDLDLNQTNSIRYSTEGWGLTLFGDTLLMTDGSNKLRFLNPEDFSTVKTLEVFDDKAKIDNLNEIEVINGICYANVYADDYIIGIDLKTGAVVEKIDFQGIIDRNRYVGPDYAFNGIAYLEKEERIFVTGKLWPILFEVEFINKPI